MDGGQRSRGMHLLVGPIRLKICRRGEVSMLSSEIIRWLLLFHISMKPLYWIWRCHNFRMVRLICMSCVSNSCLFPEDMIRMVCYQRILMPFVHPSGRCRSVIGKDQVFLCCLTFSGRCYQEDFQSLIFPNRMLRTISHKFSWRSIFRSLVILMRFLDCFNISSTTIISPFPIKIQKCFIRENECSLFGKKIRAMVFLLFKRYGMIFWH